MLEALNFRRSVLFISIEMIEDEIVLRGDKALTGRDYKDGSVKYPKLDCLCNQMGTCDRKERKNKITVREDDDIENYRDERFKKYRPCVACLDHEVGDNGINPMEKFYEEAIWWIDVENKKLTQKEYSKTVDKFDLFKSPKAKLWAPASAPTIQQIKEHLNWIEYSENFVPDVIVLDYGDIIKAEKSGDKKDMGGVYWGLKEIAKERKCAVITATQTNRDSMYGKDISITQVGEDYKKLQHVDGMLLLHQTDDEKADRIMRVSAGVVRKESFDVRQQVMVLQCLELGQVCIESKKMTIVKNIRRNDDD
jgi:hypothetical protein